MGSQGSRSGIGRARAGAAVALVLAAGGYGAYLYLRVERPTYSLPDDPRCPQGMAYVRAGVGRLLEGYFPVRPIAWGGAPSPRVIDVSIAAFCMDRNEVTVSDYESCVRAGKCAVPRPDDGTGKCNYGHPERIYHPINCVSWDDAKAYCAIHGKRLPLEDEWEYAAQGGEAHYRYPWGTDDATNRSCLKRWTRRDLTCAVRSYPPEAFGIFDLSGNVEEDTEFSCAGKPCPEAPDENNTPRSGGYWGSPGEETTEQSRSYGIPDAGATGGGFRCAK
jgi:formylglycine-generating enzyme required for sulfatase activity